MGSRFSIIIVLLAAGLLLFPCSGYTKKGNNVLKQNGYIRSSSPYYKPTSPYFPNMKENKPSLWQRFLGLFKHS